MTKKLIQQKLEKFEDEFPTHGFNSHEREHLKRFITKTVKDTLDAVKEDLPPKHHSRWGSENQEIYIAYENGFNDCREETLHSIEELKKEI